MIDSQIHVAIKSFNRAATVSTIDVVPFAWIWVPESQADAYRSSYGERIVSIPDNEDGNLCRKQNSILQHSPCPWTLILDDDITGIGRFEESVKTRLAPDEIRDMIESHFQLADQLGVKLWGINQNSDEMAYKTCVPFSLLSPILGPFAGHLQPELRYDETVHGKDDYDFWLQNIARHRMTLRANKYHYFHDHGKKPGWFVSMRTMEVEQAGVKRMQQKWGKCFTQGGSPGARRNRKVNKDGNILNSLVRVPINGC